MITKENLEKLLTVLKFTKDLSGTFWRRDFPIGCAFEVDVKGEKFYYEKAGITVTGATTANFSQNENFVVFECVCRLLEKGYRPKDIELEPTWKLGHTDKGGRADIWIRTKGKHGEVDSVLIIECKTPGREFDGAWRDTLEDGAQLFSYFKQETSSKFLCLYASDISEAGDIASDYRLIRVEDNHDYIKTLKKPKTFSAAKSGNAKDLFAVWRDTYKLDSATKGLFEQDIAPYKPGKTKYSIADLVEIDHGSMQKKYHEFATILRQHNVSGHENAFDKLVNLFLAKVVDEKKNPTDLKFYWKGIAYDDAFSLQDRLQYLYMVGMKDFLGETVTYIDEAQVKKAFGRFERDPDATKDAILKYFRELKFYTNNDFSFIDVHNPRLFRQNFAVLLAIVKMLEDIQLKTDKPNQFLGDLFEGFLDRGVKQSEGQFFTPLPIVRFIVSALPLQQLVNDASEPPRVIDYACGAGHFLNEYAQQIKNILGWYESDGAKDYYSTIVGVEKEYRLSKVAKVAAFMYGEDDIQIIYADALAKNDRIKEESFDLLVANPPYSVKGFLETLSEEDRARYDLTDCVNDLSKQNAIETFFVERAAQLLKPNGIAAIILPSSILSNGGSVYVRCREIILKSFDVIAIAEFGSGTFGKTGTNTITAFLRKKDAPPDFADHMKNRADAWFAAKHDGDEVFGDVSALERYCIRRNFDLAEYKSFLEGRLPADAALNATDAFKAYRAAFSKIKKPRFTESEYIRAQEKERLYYFLLADANASPVLIIKMPSETKAAKAYLGYEWSAAKGNEGIKYIGANSAANEDEDNALSRNKGIESINTPLFNNADLFDANKLNSLVRLNFSGALSDIPESLNPFAKQIRLVDMLDFDAVVFDKQFMTSANSFVFLKPIKGYIQYKLSDNSRFSITIGRRVLATEVSDKFSIPVYSANVQKPFGMIEKPLKSLTDFSTASIIWGIDGDWMVNFVAKNRPFYPTDHCGVLRVKTDEIEPMFLSLVLYEVGKRAGFKRSYRASTERVRNLIVNLPPSSVQKKVVAECEKVDEEYNTSRMTVEEYRVKIATAMDDVHKGNWPIMSIASITSELQYGTAEKSLPAGKVAVLRMGNIKDGLIDWSDLVYSNNEADIEKYSLQPNDVLFNRTNSPEHVGKVALYRGEQPAIFAGYLIRMKYKPEIVDPVYLSHIMNSAKVREYGFSVMSKSINQANIGGGTLAKYMIPVPPLPDQKKIVAEVVKYEAEIAKAKAVMDSAPARKQAILRKYGVVA